MHEAAKQAFRDVRYFVKTLHSVFLDETFTFGSSWKARLVGRADLHNPLTGAHYSQQRGTANRSQFLAQLAQFFQVCRLPTVTCPAIQSKSTAIFLCT